MVVVVEIFIILFYIYLYFFFFFNDTATTEIYTLSLHDALPIYETSFILPDYGDNNHVMRSSKIEQPSIIRTAGMDMRTFYPSY